MKLRFFLVTFVLSAAFLANPVISVANLEPAKRQGVSNVLGHPALRGATVGVAVTDAEGNLLFGVNENRRLIPASNQKMVSVLYAYERLGGAWQPETRFWREPDGLYIDAPGDPSIDFATVRAWRAALGDPPNGRIYVRQAYAQGVPPTWQHDYLHNRYAPQIFALSAERAGFELVAAGGRIVELEPAIGLVPRLAGGNGNASVRYLPLERSLTVRGRLPQARTVLDTLSQPDPHLTVVRLLGGEYVPLPEDHAMPEREPDLIHVGTPIAELAVTCLQRSDNYIGEHLLMMAALSEGPLGLSPYASAGARGRAFLASLLGHSEEDWVVTDGSGLSRQNFMTPFNTAQLLVFAGNGRAYSGQWREALARPGVGTLSSRLNGSRFQGKTGTISRVSALSGYVQTASGDELVISILMNNFSTDAATARRLQDQIIQVLER